MIKGNKMSNWPGFSTHIPEYLSVLDERGWLVTEKEPTWVTKTDPESIASVRLNLAIKTGLAKEKLKLSSWSEMQWVQTGNLAIAPEPGEPLRKRKLYLQVLLKSDKPCQLSVGWTQIQPTQQRPGIKGYKILDGRNVNDRKHSL